MLHVLYVVHWSSIMPRLRRLLVKNVNVFSYCKKTNCIYKKSCKTKSWPSNQRRWKVFQFCIIFSLFCKSSPRSQKQNLTPCNFVKQHVFLQHYVHEYIFILYNIIMSLFINSSEVPVTRSAFFGNAGHRARVAVALPRRRIYDI